MNNTMKRWWEYQNRSKWSRRCCSMEKKTMMARQTVMIHPVTPGPVAKLALRNATNMGPGPFTLGSATASLPKFTIWDRMWTTLQKTIDQPVALWKATTLSNRMTWLSGVRRRREMKFRHIGISISATFTYRTSAAARAMATSESGHERERCERVTLTICDAKRGTSID